MQLTYHGHGLLHRADDGHPTNGAPQAVAVVFLGLVALMLLLPVARVSFEGATEPFLLINLLDSEAGFNLFALLLLIAPIAGIAEMLLAPRSWREIAAVTALVALVSVPLALFFLSRGVHGLANGTASITPGIGSYVLLVGYLTLTVVTGIAAVRARRRR